MYKALLLILICILFALSFCKILNARDSYEAFSNEDIVNKTIKPTWNEDVKTNYDNAIKKMNSKEKDEFHKKIIADQNEINIFEKNLQKLEEERIKNNERLESIRQQEIKDKKIKLDEDLDTHVKTIQSNLKQNLKYNLLKREENIMDQVNDKLEEYKNKIYGYN